MTPEELLRLKREVEGLKEKLANARARADLYRDKAEGGRKRLERLKAERGKLEVLLCEKVKEFKEKYEGLERP